MSHTQPFNIALHFSRLVSEAAMDLPPMTHAYDAEFLRHALRDVMELFWANYLELCSEDVQALYTEALHEETGDGLEQWYKQYADFTEDKEAQARATKILTDIAAKLPKALQEEYASYTELFA